MKPGAFTYHRPHETEEAVDLLGEFGEDAKVIAGGQSLLPIMNMRLAEPPHLVDITGIPELRRTVSDGSGARYGATTTHMMIEDELVPDIAGGLLRRAAGGIGYRAIRTRGTLGGSLAHADSSAEWPTIMSALGASVHTRSPRGARRIPVRELLLGFFSTTLAPDELLTEVDVPRLPPATRWGLYKTARKPGEFAESIAVALVDAGRRELWLGAARDVPVRLTATEEALAGQELPDIDELVDPVAADLGVDVDVDVCDPLERHALQRHAVTVHRAVRAAERAESHV